MFLLDANNVFVGFQIVFHKHTLENFVHILQLFLSLTLALKPKPPNLSIATPDFRRVYTSILLGEGLLTMTSHEKIIEYKFLALVLICQVIGTSCRRNNNRNDLQEPSQVYVYC